MKVFVLTSLHTEYRGWSVFEGIFKTKEEAIEAAHIPSEYKVLVDIPYDESLNEEHNDDYADCTFVFCIAPKEQKYFIKPTTGIEMWDGEFDKRGYPEGNIEDALYKIKEYEL